MAQLLDEEGAPSTISVGGTARARSLTNRLCHRPAPPGDSSRAPGRLLCATYGIGPFLTLSGRIGASE